MPNPTTIKDDILKATELLRTIHKEAPLSECPRINEVEDEELKTLNNLIYEVSEDLENEIHQRWLDN